MPLFRWHRGGLQESIATTIIVKSKSELTAKLLADWEPWLNINGDEDFKFEVDISYYPDKLNCFDARIGWYTQIVTCKYNGKSLGPAGFLSEPFLEAVKVPIGG